MLQFRSGVPSTAGELKGCSKGTHCAARGAGIFRRRGLGENRLHHGGMPLTLSCFVSQHLLRSMISTKMTPRSTSWKRATLDHRLNSRNRWAKINPPVFIGWSPQGFSPGHGKLVNTSGCAAGVWSLHPEKQQQITPQRARPGGIDPQSQHSGGWSRGLTVSTQPVWATFWIQSQFRLHSGEKRPGDDAEGLEVETLLAQI